MEFTSEEIRSAFDKLPREVQVAVSAPETYERSKSIGEKAGLNTTQLVEMIDETSLVLMGLKKESEFIDNVSKRCEIPKENAEKIVSDLKREIFEPIKQQVQQTKIIDKKPVAREEPTIITKTSNFTSTHHAEAVERAVEKAGGFEIEKEHEQHSGNYGDLLINGVHLKNPALAAYLDIDRTNKLEYSAPEQNPIDQTKPNNQDISPNSSQQPGKAPDNLPGAQKVVGMTDKHTDALVDHLLDQVATAIQEKIAKKYTPPPPPRGEGPDPYREAAK